MSPAGVSPFPRVPAQMSYVVPTPPRRPLQLLRRDLGRLQRSLPGARVWNNEEAFLIGRPRVFMTPGRRTLNAPDLKGIRLNQIFQH